MSEVVKKWNIGERVTLEAQFIAGESEGKMFWAKCYYLPMRCNVFLRYKGDRHTAAHLRAYTKTADKVTVSGVVGEEFKEVSMRTELWRMITITIEGTDDIRVHSQFDYSHIKPYESEVSKRRRLAEERKNRLEKK